MKCLVSGLLYCCRPIPQRYVLALLLGIGLCMMFMLRLSFSIALTQMAFVEEDVDYDEGIEEEEECYKEMGSPEEENNREFDWTAKDKHILLTSYFCGYALANFFGGVLSVLYGGKVVLNTGLLISGLGCLLTPVCARQNYWLLFCIRILIGIGTGVFIPGATTLVAKWSPPNERSRIVAVIFSGIAVGTIGGVGLSAYIIDSLSGWEDVFYIYGTKMVFWCVLFYFFSYGDPDSHRFITDKERNMIKDTIGVTSKQIPNTIPWFQIFTSMPVVVYILINFAHGWLMMLVTVEMPLYFKYVLKFNIMETGSRLSVPFIAMLVSNIIAAAISDWLITTDMLSVTNNRKIFGVLSNILPMPFLMGVPYAGCDKYTATFLMTFMMFFKGMAFSSLKANAVDLSPNYAGILAGLANGIAGLGGLGIPSLISMFVIEEEGTIADWRKMFFFSTGILIIFTVPYGFFASGDVQQWNNEIEELED